MANVERLIAESEEQLIARLAMHAPGGDESEVICRVLDFKRSDAEGKAAKALLDATGNLVSATGRLACATWALVASTGVLVLAAAAQAYAMFRWHP